MLKKDELQEENRKLKEKLRGAVLKMDELQEECGKLKEKLRKLKATLSVNERANE